mmetsp:Transcript_52825/g.53226  ORF Transcript_52825/g.53226 Transcript_52825/m.53226 type:complete len:132 (+) Transcript_52825:321-716(+)
MASSSLHHSVSCTAATGVNVLLSLFVPSQPKTSTSFISSSSVPAVGVKNVTVSLLASREESTIGDGMGVAISDGIGVVMDGATISAIGNEIMSDATDGATIFAMGNEKKRWEMDGATIGCCVLWNKETRNW